MTNSELREKIGLLKKALDGAVDKHGVGEPGEAARDVATVAAALRDLNRRLHEEEDEYEA